jgi:hypothetical protein
VEALTRLAEQPVYDFRALHGDPPTEVFDQFRRADPIPGKPPTLLTVDRFAEGVSVNDIDMLVMLRATLSPRVAMQALGRGLRNHPGKERCVIVDGVLLRERVKQWENVDAFAEHCEEPRREDAARLLTTSHTEASTTDRVMRAPQTGPELRRLVASFGQDGLYLAAEITEVELETVENYMSRATLPAKFSRKLEMWLASGGTEGPAKRSSSRRRLNVPREGDRLGTLLDRLDEEFGISRKQVARGCNVSEDTLRVYCSVWSLNERFREKLKDFLDEKGLR